jgi:hypothetical protein
VQCLQHEAVAAERHHDIGLLGVVLAVDPPQAQQRRLRLLGRSRDEREALGLCGTFSHGMARRGLDKAAEYSVGARRRQR